MKKPVQAIWINAAVALATAGLPVSSAHTQQSVEEHDEARAAMKAGEVMPYNKLKRLIEKQTGGSIVGQRLRRTGRGWMYELRIRGDKGRVQYLMVNAKDGTIITPTRR